VQAAGHLVALAAELAACVELGHHDLEGRYPGVRHCRYGNTASIVADADPAVGQQRYDDVIAEALEGLVDAVVDDLVDQMVEASGAGRADVHAGPAANGLQALENGDVFGVIAGF